MRIVIVSDYGRVNGGAAKVAIVSARKLAERGHEVHFVCALEPSDPALVHHALQVHHLGVHDVWNESNRLRAAIRGIWNRAVRQRLAEIVGAFDQRSTVVHLHQWTKALSPSVLAAVKAAEVPVVITLHDYFLFCPNGLYFDHHRRRPCTRRPLGLQCMIAACDSQSRAHKVVRLIRQVGSNAACRRLPLNLIHVSRAAQAVAREHFPADTRHFVVPNPVSLEQCPAVAVARNRTFVFLGRYTPEKGPIIFARAAANAGVPAAFLGAGPEAAGIRAANPTAEVGSWGDDQAVAALLGRARALVFPSLWRETSGLVVLEALSRGVPVICSRSTGAADWIEDGVNGFIVRPGNQAAFTERLRRLATDDALATRLGAAAYIRYWRETPTPTRHAECLEACYGTVLSGTA
jgi:glycosyltransferase involved in cell wall biosynthesis